MIYDTNTHIARYKGLCPHLDRAIRFIETADLAALPAGRTEIDGDTVFVNHFSYQTAPQTDASLYEDHAVYLDLHYPLAGAELVAVAPADTLREVERRPDEDAVLYAGGAGLALPLSAGSFLLVYPGEAHLPKLAAGAACTVDKLVFKIRL